MKVSELKSLIREMIYEAINQIDGKIEEKSVPEPYDRKSRRRMTASQIARREKIGRAMEKNKSTVRRLQDKHGDEWRDYLWAIASGKALQGE